MRKTLFLALLSSMLLCACKRDKVQKEIQPVKVKTMTVGNMSMESGQAYSGTIEEMSGTSLSFAGMGTVRTLHVAEGQFVRQGHLVATLDASTSANSVSMAQATTSQAEDALKQAEDAYERMKMLHDNGSLPEIQWIEMETKLSQARSLVKQAKAAEQIARKGVTDTRLVAPFSGYIIKKNVEVGSNVAPGQPVAKLVRIDQVKVKIAVPEEEIPAISKGMRLDVKVPALANRHYMARVGECGVAADPLSRSYEVKAVIPNPNHDLLPGMVCEVTTEGLAPKTSPASRSAWNIAIPAHIVQIDADNQPFVWTVVGGKAHKTMVETGENAGDLIVIDKGLRSGDKVVVEGQQKISTDMIVEE